MNCWPLVIWISDWKRKINKSTMMTWINKKVIVPVYDVLNSNKATQITSWAPYISDDVHSLDCDSHNEEDDDYERAYAPHVIDVGTMQTLLTMRLNCNLIFLPVITDLKSRCRGWSSWRLDCYCWFFNYCCCLFQTTLDHSR